ncbi:MAG: hypothetical protein HC860_26180 [Alkalinema sp. RU_4_3]|nr:hypothetical protein [Alkalinema sp. RU_4_3]
MQNLLQTLERHSKAARFIHLAIAAGAAVVTFNAVGILIYSALGQSLDSPAGRYSLVLYGVMMVTMFAFALQRFSPRIAQMIAMGAAAAVVGFYYGGRAIELPLEQQVPWAIAGTVIAALMAGGLSFIRAAWVQVGLGIVRTIVIYGAAFLNGVVGLMLLSVWQWWGVGLVGLAVFGLGMTARSFLYTLKLL